MLRQLPALGFVAEAVRGAVVGACGDGVSPQAPPHRRWELWGTTAATHPTSKPQSAHAETHRM